MRFAWTHIIFALLLAGTSLATESNDELDSERKVEEEEEYEDSSNQDALLDLDDELRDLEDKLKNKHDNGNLPILPPLILLDFTNGTNSTDDKSKRTINGHLGYGFQNNNIFSGKYNYYFPSGKSGTTVSIEESISPFLPKTIIERVKPITEESENSHKYDGDRRENQFFAKNSATPSPIQNHQATSSNHQHDHTQAIFGQRTKLQKTTANLGSFAGFSTTPRTHLRPYTTPSPDSQSSTGFASYNSFSSTPKPTYQSNPYSPGVNYVSSTTGNPLFYEYSTPAPIQHITPAAYHANYHFDPYSSQRTILEPATSPAKQVNPTTDYYSASLEALSNYPRYTVENGIRYEHKIVWKYPDGRVSDTPPPSPPSPTSYLNSYSEHPSQKATPTANYQNIRYNSRPSYQQQHHQLQLQQQQQNYNLYSQRPAEFPKQESEVQKANQFVSSASYSQESANYNPGSADPSFPYEVVYQNPYSAKQNLRHGVHGFSSNQYYSGSRASQRNPYHSKKSGRPVPKYAVNSPNPNYIGTSENPTTTESSDSSKLFTSSGQLSSSVLSKYTPDAQRYLSKVFASGKNSGKNSYESKVEPQYADLLKYNPSISQYIKNPSSILNAQPTFVQAGNSLIPVIILRVDGAPPVQPKATPNINLKALLQQYLTQYAQSLSDMTQDSSYDLGNDYYEKSQTSGASNPISELAQLTHSLSRFSQDPTIATEYQNRFPQNSEYDRRQYEPTSGYVPTLKQGQRHQQTDEDRIVETVNRYTSQGKKLQKVKSVEIIEDPRYTSYKSIVNNSN